MNRWGCFGLILGSALGLLVVVLLLLLLRPAPPASAVQPAAPLADVEVFLSERTLSRFASTAMASPTVIEVEPEGQLSATTRVKAAGFEPVVELRLGLSLQGSIAVSRLLWVQLSFIRVPASWLPPEIVELGALPGQTITQQLPPGFSLAGLTTTSEGITLQLNWTGN